MPMLERASEATEASAFTLFDNYRENLIKIAESSLVADVRDIQRGSVEF